MSLRFCFLLNVILLSRLVFTFQDNPVSKKRTLVLILLQFIGLLVYKLDFTWVLLAIILGLVGVSFHFLERRYQKVDLLRLLSLLIYVSILSVFFSSWVNISLNPGISGNIDRAGNYCLLFTNLKDIDWLKLNILALGLLLSTNEANILIRCLFQFLHLAPKRAVNSKKDPSSNLDKREYNAGRVIGVLERTLVYYLVLNAQFTAIGFIIAAKSFTRFKELENREFAEYVLIGTLLSTLLAVAIASTIRVLLP
jgi:hypothetical protein